MSEEAVRPLLAANWKMNPVRASDAADLGRGVVDAARNAAQTVDVVILPPFPWLLVVGELVGGTGVGLGAQDCFWEQAGAYTGEVSAAMLSSWCGWVLAGHSERRNQFGETDEWVSLKVRAALSAGLQVILCVGELDEEFEAGQTEAVVSRQLRAATQDLSLSEASRLVIAYEPVWAIGTGKNADPEHARRTLKVIREVLQDSFSLEVASRLRILYGGSVNATNVASYVALPLCDGCLVGGASLKSQEFASLIQVVAEVYGALPGAGDEQLSRC